MRSDNNRCFTESKCFRSKSRYPRLASDSTAIGSVYGVSFLIEDAQAIPIEVPPQSLSWLEEKHYRCKMFQFAYQMFETGEINLTPGEPVRRLRERWRSISQINQDESGCVIDPGTASTVRHPHVESIPA